MTIAQSLLAEFDTEMANTRRVLERVPDGKTDWRPHEKSMPLGRLATHVAEFGAWATNTIAKDGLEFGPDFKPTILKTTAEIVALFDQNVREARAVLAAAPDAEFVKTWTLKFSGRVVFAMPKLAVYRRTVMNHMIHHRAQLGVYLRLLGVALPGLYGPTADEQAF